MQMFESLRKSVKKMKETGAEYESKGVFAYSVFNDEISLCFYFCSPI